MRSVAVLIESISNMRAASIALKPTGWKMRKRIYFLRESSLPIVLPTSHGTEIVQNLRQAGCKARELDEQELQVVEIFKS